jgi:rfaE bifunctional protein nucleotidyltransferase chain/domain
MRYYLTPTSEELAIARSSEEYKNYRVSPFYDYLNKGFIKPWGYEYMAYQSKDVGVWILNVNQGLQTSVHCHFHKDTVLCVLSGTFRIELYNDFKILNEGDVCYIPACMFHGIFAYSPNAVLLEVEVYHRYTECGIDGAEGVRLEHSDKNDLLRLRDVYTRDKNTYMGSAIEYTTGDASGNDIVYPFYNLHTSDIVYGSTIVSKDAFVKTVAGAGAGAAAGTLTILLEGQIRTSGCAILSPGSIVDTDNSNATASTENTSVLRIMNLYQDDNRKLIYTKTHLCDIIRSLRGPLGVEAGSNKRPVIGLTSGCFDIFHSGHISTLKQSKNMCDVFFICLSSDKQIREIKGPSRPVNHIEDRARMLLTMPFIDYVILYDETDNTYEKELDNIMLMIQPDVWFKGSDYTERGIRGKHPSLKRIVLFNNLENKSTTNIINKINASSSSSASSAASASSSVGAQVFL